MKVLLSPAAKEYITSGTSYLRQKNPAATRKFVEKLRNLRVKLAAFPKIGHQREDQLVPGVHRFVLGSYLVDYEIGDDLLVILANRHGRQSPLDLKIDVDTDFEESK